MRTATLFDIAGETARSLIFVDACRDRIGQTSRGASPDPATAAPVISRMARIRDKRSSTPPPRANTHTTTMCTAMASSPGPYGRDELRRVRPAGDGRRRDAANLCRERGAPLDSEESQQDRQSRHADQHGRTGAKHAARRMLACRRALLARGLGRIDDHRLRRPDTPHVEERLQRTDRARGPAIFSGSTPNRLSPSGTTSVPRPQP